MMLKNPQNGINYFLSVFTTMGNEKGQKLIIIILIIATTAVAHYWLIQVL
jgi:hypothetical protein